KGIGTRLLKKMESDLKKKKVPQVGLFASTENPEAVDFYLRNGYVEVKKFGSVMGRYIYMRKKL
ncbi:TPA: GNAT family N-acetyltransferase, partial [archaeon]|nr:GNAT family N-acetyltransferase [Candidatus Naiadarchaeales archaeon SRR2090153.bin461]